MNNLESAIKPDKQFLKLKEQTLEVIRSSAQYLNTREMNVFEYLKDDRLVDELIVVRKQLKEQDLSEIDRMIHWLDDEWFSYKLNERMAMLYTLHPF